VRTEIGSTRRLAARFAAIIVYSAITIALGAGAVQAKQPYAGIVMDAKTGKVLYSHEGTSTRFPASLTKMMTLYMMFEAMEQGKVTKKTRIRFSRHAASMVPSKLGVKAGSSISAEQAIYALVTKSANDAAAAVGEHLGGTESEFAAMMTRKARQLGMSKTTFKNASGLPNSKQVTTAKDMAILGIALREHFPDKYRYFSTRNFKFGKYNYRNHNRLLGAVTGVDGIKTGYTRASGFNLVSSVESGRRSIVAVVLGGKTGKSRNAQMQKLIRLYLPKASKGRDRMIVAKGRSTSIFAALFKKSQKAPVPKKRPELKALDVVTTASVATSVTAAEPAPQPVAVASKPAVETAQPELIETGWHVQIGAMPDKENAIRHLDNARAKLPGLFDDVANYTETVESNGTLLYRARFAGYQSKDAAWNACDRLKKAKIDCLALQQ